MAIKEIQAKSILRKHKRIDSWFLSRYGMNLYRGCAHNCIYCDGRLEKYNVNGEFGEDVVVKTNTIDLLEKELNPNRKRVPMKPCYIMLGGGVGDSYQPIEKKYKLGRKTLLLLKKYNNHPVHILTKSTLIERDLDILKEINQQNKVIVSFSFSSVDDRISKIFEPGVPSPSERMETLSNFKKEGIACGMFLLPVIPFITDNPEKINDSIKKAKHINIDFVIFGGMTLKKGKQEQYFLTVLKKHFPHLIVEYKNIYKDDKWGNAIADYYTSINQTFYLLSKKYNIPVRIPPYLFTDILNENDRVIVILEHIDYLLKLRGRKSPYGYAAYSISKIKQPISNIIHKLREIKGVGKTTEKIILDILKTGTSSYYENLLF